MVDVDMEVALDQTVAVCVTAPAHHPRGPACGKRIQLHFSLPRDQLDRL